MLHCYFYLFLKFPCILFLFQAESVKEQFDAMANGAILAEELKNEGGLGWRVKKRVGSGSSCLRFLFVAPMLLTCRLFISLHFTDQTSATGQKGTSASHQRRFYGNQTDSSWMTKQEVYTSTTTYLNPGGNTVSSLKQTSFPTSNFPNKVFC